MIARVRYWDLAASKDGAFTAGVRMSAKDGVYYVENIVHGRWTPYERDLIILQTAQLDAELFQNSSAVKIYIEQEPGSSGVSLIQSLIKMLAGYSVYGDRPTGDKDTRLEPFAAQAEAGNVRLVRGMWNEAYIDEMCAIPNGTYRDQADASAGAFNKLTGGRTSSRRIGVRGYGER